MADTAAAQGGLPAPGWPLQRDLGRLPNRLSGVAMLQAFWQWCCPFVNDFRRRHGLPPATDADFYRSLTANPLLGAYSPPSSRSCQQTAQQPR